MIQPHKVRFAARDRLKFGCDEWLPFDNAAFVEVPLSTLRKFDATVQAAIGVKLYDLLRVADGVDLGDMETQAVIAWLALRLACPGACEFIDFDPALIGIDRDYSPEPEAPAGGGDVDPPASSSDGPSEETPPPATPKPSRSRATKKS
jgi:hypothetical protein